MHFHERFLHILIEISLKIVSKGLNDDMWILVQVLDWCPIGDKTLPEPTRWVDGTPTSEFIPGHYLVDPYTWPWSPNGQDHIWPWKFKCQGHGQGQTHWSHLRPGVQSICLLFVSWQSDHFWLRYSKFHNWPWKFKVKVMANLKSDGHIWGLEFNWYVCFSFRGNGTIFGCDIVNFIFDLENSRSRSWPRSNPMVTFEA